MKKIMKKIMKRVLATALTILLLISPVSIIGTTIVSNASNLSDPLVSRVWQYCIDIDRNLVNQVKSLDLTNANEYNIYVNAVNLMNRSKKESMDLFKLAGSSEHCADDAYVAHSLRKGLQEDLVFRASVGLGGLIFNSEAVKYLTGQEVEKDRYKKALKDFMKYSKADLELCNTSKDIVGLLKAATSVVDNEKGRAVIRSTIMTIYQAKSLDDMEYALKLCSLDDYFKDDLTVDFKCGNITKALGLAGDMLSVTSISVKGIYNLASISANLELYQSYSKFLEGISSDKSLPVNLRIAADEINSDIISQYGQAIKDIGNEIKGFLAGKSLKLAAQELGSVVLGDVLAAISLGKLLFNVFFNAKDMVESCAMIECYDILASKYAKTVLKDKANFSLNPSEANAEKFKYDYTILQQLRLTGEEKTLAMIGYDKMWLTPMKKLMRTVMNYKENKVLLKSNIEMLKNAAFMSADDDATYNMKILPFYDTTVNVQCPVNVRIYDESNNLVASVVNEELNELENDLSDYSVVVYHEDNDKIVRMVSSNNYRVEIDAYDSGSMTYSAAQYTDKGELATETVYENVEIDKGDTFVSNPEEKEDAACRVLYESNDDLKQLEPTKEYDNKKLPSEDADAAEVIVAEELFKDIPQELTDKVADAMFNFKESVNIESFNLSTDAAVALFSAIAKSYPSEYSLLSRSAFTYKIAFSPSRGNITSIRFYYGENANLSDYQRRVTETQNAVNRLVEKTKGMSDFEKALYVHDYIVLNCEYDEELLTLKNADGTLDGEIYSERYTEYSVLVNGTGICGSYALAYRTVMNACGVECLYLSSMEMNHGWNLIKLDGSWYHVDCCWDDPTPDRLGVARRTYFLRTDDEMMELEHYSWSPGNYKANSSKYSSMPRNDDSVQKYEDGCWYYLDSGTIYSCDTYGNDRQEIASVTVNCVEIEDGELFYSYGRGIYSLDTSSGDGTLSYYLPDAACIGEAKYSFIRNMYIDGDDLLGYTGFYTEDAYQFRKYERADCLSSANRAKGLSLNETQLSLGFAD